MNLRLLTSFLCVFALTTGCIIVDADDPYTPPPPPPVPGDVSFSWSLAGSTCAQMPEVRSISIQIPGEPLQNDGVYPCSVNGMPGVTLHDFVPGSYAFTIDAWSYSGERLFVGSGSFTVNGDVRVSIDLTPVGGPTSYAYLSWTFPQNSQSANPTCQQAGVSAVDVSIDGAAWTRYDCAAGWGSGAVQSVYLEPGTHTVEMVAVDAYDYPYYRTVATLQTFSGAPVAADYVLQWGVGGVAVKWQLTDGSTGQTCAQAGVQEMRIQFVDASGQPVYPNGGDVQACDGAPIVYNYLQPGTYRVYIQATGSNGRVYLSNDQAPPSVTVKAGRFMSDADAVTVQLFRTQ